MFPFYLVFANYRKLLKRYSISNKTYLTSMRLVAHCFLRTPCVRQSFLLYTIVLTCTRTREAGRRKVVPVEKIIAGSPVVTLIVQRDRNSSAAAHVVRAYVAVPVRCNTGDPPAVVSIEKRREELCMTGARPRTCEPDAINNGCRAKVLCRLAADRPTGRICRECVARYYFHISPRTLRLLFGFRERYPPSL